MEMACRNYGTLSSELTLHNGSDRKKRNEKA
jgi:hypothetical protein